MDWYSATCKFLTTGATVANVVVEAGSPFDAEQMAISLTGYQETPFIYKWFVSIVNSQRPQPSGNVQAWGAVGNNVTDDTLAFQKAIAAGGPVSVPYTPAGYKVGALTLPPGTKLVFEPGAKLVAPSSVIGSWITAQPNAVHTGTSVYNGTFDASAIISSLCTAVLDWSQATTLIEPRIDKCKVINAPVHGIYMSETTKTGTPKWIEDCYVTEHGLVATGFGIYADYIGNVLIKGNTVYTAGVDDSIELGHSGPAWIGINYYLKCEGNTVTGGQINYPFSDFAEIINNTVVGNTIQNDGNTANSVKITGNRVLEATPSAGFSGINVFGNNPTIVANYVQVSTLNGIGGTWSHGVCTNNEIVSTSAGNSGFGVTSGSSQTGNKICDNDISGNFAYAVNLWFTFSNVDGNVITTFNGMQANGVSYTSITNNEFNIANTVLVGALGTECVYVNNPGVN